MVVPMHHRRGRAKNRRVVCGKLRVLRPSTQRILQESVPRENEVEDRWWPGNEAEWRLRRYEDAIQFDPTVTGELVPASAGQVAAFLRAVAPRGESG